AGPGALRRGARRLRLFVPRQSPRSHQDGRGAGLHEQDRRARRRELPDQRGRRGLRHERPAPGGQARGGRRDPRRRGGRLQRPVDRVRQPGQRAPVPAARDDEHQASRRAPQLRPVRAAGSQGEGRFSGPGGRGANERGGRGGGAEGGARHRALDRQPDHRQVLTDYAAFMKQAERGEPPALALLHGGDVQLLDDALDAVTRGLFPDRSLAAWGREVFDARESNADDIVRSASTLPLGVGRRLVAVRRAQALAAKGAEALTGYAKSPNPASCLMLLADEPLRASRERRTDHWLLGALPAAAIVELPTRGARDLAG